jgi:hypothetical protein
LLSLSVEVRLYYNIDNQFGKSLDGLKSMEAFMDVIRSDEVQWSGPLDMRDGGIEFKHLFVGEPGKPDNYWLSLVRVRNAYHTPPHKHNFDQVRFILDGAFGFGEQVQETGQIGYFCEGTSYEQKADGPSLTLLLQTANASRSRYLGWSELIQGNREVQKFGRFEDGIFVSEMDGVEIRKDAYEAVWEHISGEKIAYSEPRYDRPIIMDPDRFQFTSLGEGVSRKRLGMFSERDLELGFLKIEAGHGYALDGSMLGRTLFFVRAGTGTMGDKEIGPDSAMRLEAEDVSELKATEDLEMFYIGMPK